ncbi:anti-sigma factor [Nocardioides pantholopis]|uniref:anti-sigma factor n=1 Tax=Nocardioides pantholopis TaxID=2483798 RepID=UPI000F09274B|nr:anti-sigma factor [Nocardioides pantholopis]
MAGDSLAGSTHGPGPRPDVELRLPADGAYVSVLRTTTAGLAARLDFTIDDIEDLRIAVGEACAIVLPEADPASDLCCRFYLQPGRLTVAVGVDTTTPAAPDPDSFAWQVLTTIAESARSETAPGSLTVTMTMRSSLFGDDA